MLFYNEKIFKRCFNYKGKYWYKNIKYIPLYFTLMHQLIKYGYDEYATWETFSWFTDTMRSVLTNYRKNHYGYPAEMSEVEWDKTIDHMIELLDLMDDGNPKYDDTEYDGGSGLQRQYAEMEAAKDEFFALFSKYFYNMWD